MTQKLTAFQIKALTFLSKTSWDKPTSAAGFAHAMWGDSDTTMFSSSKNTGNGACRGKAAWLCGGSYLGKLREKGWVRWGYEPTGYYITEKGKEILKNNTNAENTD